MATEKFYEELKGAFMGGRNIKKDASVRQWGMVCLTGNSMTNSLNEVMFEGTETTAPGKMEKAKWVNISTFTGVLYVKSKDYRTYYHAGKKVARGLVEEIQKSTTPEVQEALQAFLDADEPTVKVRLRFIGMPVPD